MITRLAVAIAIAGSICSAIPAGAEELGVGVTVGSGDHDRDRDKTVIGT
jgi:hypothetical protein